MGRVRIAFKEMNRDGMGCQESTEVAMGLNIRRWVGKE
jgi:hypothetical protein